MILNQLLNLTTRMSSFLVSEIVGYGFLLLFGIIMLFYIGILLIVVLIDIIPRVTDFFKSFYVTDAKAQYDIGIKHYKWYRFDCALKWFHKAVEQNYVDAEFMLGKCYARGEGVEKNNDEAIKWYRKAAEKGHVLAQFELGQYYYKGDCVERNIAEAEKWYRKAAENGDVSAQYKLAYIYANGVEVERNIAEAEKWSRKGAEQRSSNAKKVLAFCLCYNKAEQDMPEAQFELGQYYYNGDCVERNIDEAIKWYRKAAENGYAKAQAQLDQINANDKNVKQNEAKDNCNDLNHDSNGIDNSVENQNVISKTEPQNPKPTNPWENVALGIDFYFVGFLLSLIAPIVIPIFVFIWTVLSTLKGDMSGDAINKTLGVIDTIGVCCGFAFAVIGYFMLCAIYFFCHTPNEIVPNAKNKIRLSFVLVLIVEAITFIEICFPEYFYGIISDSFLKAYDLIMLGLMFCSYYIFYSFLNIIGKKAIQKGCKVAIFLLITSYIFAAVNMIIASPVDSEVVDDKIPSLLDIFNTGNLLSNISWITYIIGAILIFYHVILLNLYFYQNNLRKTFYHKNFSKNERRYNLEKGNYLPWDGLQMLFVPGILISLFLICNLFHNLFHTTLFIEMLQKYGQ